jgi:hypothetical protein
MLVARNKRHINLQDPVGIEPAESFPHSGSSRNNETDIIEKY